MHGKAPLTSILLCLEKIAVSHGPFNGLDSLKRTKGFRNPYHNKTKNKTFMIGLFGEKYVTEIEKNFSNLPRAGLKAFAL